MELSELAYEIIDECKCGFEEFSVLVSSVFPGTEDELTAFVKTLSNLIDDKLIVGKVCGSEELQNITRDHLKAYVSKRIEAGEALDDYPSVCEEYCFITSEYGISFLEDTDKPIGTVSS